MFVDAYRRNRVHANHHSCKCAEKRVHRMKLFEATKPSPTYQTSRKSRVTIEDTKTRPVHCNSGDRRPWRRNSTQGKSLFDLACRIVCSFPECYEALCTYVCRKFETQQENIKLKALSQSYAIICSLKKF